MKVCFAFLFLTVGKLNFIDAGSAPEHNRGGFERRVFERIISMAEKYLDFLKESRKTIPVPVGSCLPGFVKDQTHCYKIFDFGLNWADAKTFCAALNTDLATIENAKTQEFIKGQITKGSYKQKKFWIGGTDIETEGKFLWTDRYNKTRPVTTYTSWAKGQPDSSSEGCIDLHSTLGLNWNDYNCKTAVGFVCQGP